jgi:predicted transglutaminase-like cysteine proteinase
VNVQVNHDIAPKHDDVDRWLPDAFAGDCEDFALTKRQRLIDLGWAPSQLLIAVVDDPGQGPQAVLIARTDQGDLVLDNLTDTVLPWQATGLTFLSRQSEKLPAMWVKL